MKKKPFLLLIASILLFSGTRVRADAPYTTWAIGPAGYPVMTQDAYTPSAEVDLDVNGPQDLYITPDGTMYIADTGNGRILKLQDFAEVGSYGEGILQGPTGVFVDPKGTIYVADAKKNTIVIMDANGKLIKEFGRPDEPLFGRTREFLPRKIAVDARENLYIISEGSVDGIVLMNTNGDFIGYFGANTATMSLKMILQRMFLTEEQLAQYIKNEAASPSNVAIDQQSLVYTITAGTARNKSIRKFTIAGKNIWPDSYGSLTFRDIEVGEQGLVLAVDSNGQINEYDTNGHALFFFGAKDTGEQRLGTLLNPAAIARDGETIHVLDQDKNAIVSYHTTDFARRVHEGVRLYMDGYYAEAKPIFEQVLNYNGSLIMSYQAIADAYYKEGDYVDALPSYRYAEDRAGYSEAFWELRNRVIQATLANALLLFAGVWVAQKAVVRLERRRRWFDPIRDWLARLKKVKLVDDVLFMFRFIRHPADSFYYIKKDLRGSMAFALLLYAWIVLVRVVSLYITAFPFNPYASSAEIRVESEIIKVVLLIGLWNAANYLVSTISDGEGRVRDVIIGTAYSLFPYALIALPVALLSNVLTLNEEFLYTFSLQIMWAWTAIMLFIMVKEIHNYTFSETVKNVLMTLFTMALFVLSGYILFVLFTQLYDFVSAIVQEIGLRA
jgi:tetratricopeptide (TPR) repeat protein